MDIRARDQLTTASDVEALFGHAKKICVLTGAGISQESGVPTFRGPNGLWKQFRPEDLATPEAFARDPLLVWEWYAWRRELISRAQPNAAHHALARLEATLTDAGGRFTVLTQNVDGFMNAPGRATSSGCTVISGSFAARHAAPSDRTTPCRSIRSLLAAPARPSPRK